MRMRQLRNRPPGRASYLDPPDPRGEVGQTLTAGAKSMRTMGRHSSFSPKSYGEASTTMATCHYRPTLGGKLIGLEEEGWSGDSAFRPNTAS